MDFIIGLPLTPKKKDMIWVIMDRLRMHTSWPSIKRIPERS
jgi:hypothetical protein